MEYYLRCFEYMYKRNRYVAIVTSDVDYINMIFFTIYVRRIIFVI